MGRVDARSLEAFKRDASEMMGSKQRRERHTRAERRSIVCDDRGRTSERRAEPAGQQLPFGGHLQGKSIENQVKIDLSGDSDIKGLAMSVGHLITLAFVVDFGNITWTGKRGPPPPLPIFPLIGHES